LRIEGLTDYANGLRGVHYQRRRETQAIKQASKPRVTPDIRYPPSGKHWPAYVIPGSVDWALILGRNDDTLIWMHRFAAYPTGLMCLLEVRLRPGTHERHIRHTDPDEFTGADQVSGLRYGLQVATGDTAVLQHDPSGGEYWPRARTSGPMTLRQMGGGGDPFRLSQGLWLNPLPPDGPMSFAAVWPERDIDETVVTVDAGEALAAADRAVEGWPKWAASADQHD
jgi:hypothetical protein